MTDEQLLAALEACKLPPVAFDHREHVRAAFLYLERLPFGAAIDAMSAALRRYVAALGRADRYHETVTVAFLALVNASRLEKKGAEDWPAFAARNPHLLNSRLLADYYSRATLAAEDARRRFVLERRPTAPPLSDPGRRQKRPRAAGADPPATGSAPRSRRAGRSPAARADRHS